MKSVYSQNKFHSNCIHFIFKHMAKASFTLAIFCVKTSAIRSRNSANQLALATFGDATQIGSFLLVSHRQKWPRQIGGQNHGVKSQMFSPKNFKCKYCFNQHGQGVLIEKEAQLPLTSSPWIDIYVQGILPNKDK